MNHIRTKDRHSTGNDNPSFQNSSGVDTYGERSCIKEKPYRLEKMPTTDATGNFITKERLQEKPSWIQMIDEYKFDTLPAWTKTIDTRGSWKK